MIGWRHIESLNIPVNMGERTTRFATDEQGYRIDPGTKAALPKTDASVLMIGDSFLEALGVENEETIPQRLRGLIEKKYGLRIHAVNAGVGGWQPGQYLLEVRRALRKASFDLGVVFLYLENDLVEKIQLEFEAQQITPAMTIRLPKNFQWGSLKKDVLYPINNYLEQRSHLFVFLKNRFQILLARLGLTPYYFPDIFYRQEAGSVRWDMTTAVVQKIHQEFKQAQIPVLFVLLPADYQVYPELIAKYIKMFGIAPDAVDLDQPNQKLMERFRRKAIPAIDMLPIFKEKSEKGLYLYGLIDNHMNAQGQAVVAEAIFPWVERHLKLNAATGRG